MEKKLNEQIEKNVELNKDNADKTRNEVMSEVGSDLADTQKEKFKTFEEIEYSTSEDFKKKCETIKDHTLEKKIKDESLDDISGNELSSLNSEDLSKTMSEHISISKTKKILKYLNNRKRRNKKCTYPKLTKKNGKSWSRAI